MKNKEFFLEPRQLFALFSLTLACMIANGDTGMEQHIEGGIALMLPDDVTMSSESPVEDFVLYKFTNRAGKTLLVAYIGNQPKKLEIPFGASKSTFVLSDLSADAYKWSTSASDMYGDVRMRLQQDGWPCWLQFSYGPLNETELNSSLHIINSIHHYKKG